MSRFVATPGVSTLADEHARGCKRRQFSCNCGYDAAKDDELERCRAALREVVKLRMATTHGSLRARAHQMAAIAANALEMETGEAHRAMEAQHA